MMYYIPILRDWLGTGLERAMINSKSPSLEDCLTVWADSLEYRPGHGQVIKIIVVDNDDTLIKTLSITEAKRMLKVEQL